MRDHKANRWNKEKRQNSRNGFGKQNRWNKKSILFAFWINLLIGTAAFAWTILGQGGLFSLAGDFNSQQIPFVMNANRMLHEGGFWGFDYSIDLGSGFVGAMSFYLLGTPGFWIAQFFPARYYMYIVGWLYVLKYAAAGMTSYIYICRFVKQPRSALIGSMLYAFSGFMNENLLFYHFHDVVMLFPLMLITLDDLVEKKRRGPFIFAVCINALVNYYFLVGEVIYLVLYYCIRWFIPRFREYGKTIWNVLFEGVLGGVMSMVLLWPAFLFVIQNPRVKNDYYGSNSLVYNAQRYLFILKGLIFPAEVMSDHTAVIDRNFSSCAAYLPLFGIVLVAAYLYYRKKDWLSNMLKASLVIACVPILNAAFSAFAGLYCRWYYMPILLMATASAVMVDEAMTADHAAGYYKESNAKSSGKPRESTGELLTEIAEDLLKEESEELRKEESEKLRKEEFEELLKESGQDQLLKMPSETGAENPVDSLPKKSTEPEVYTAIRKGTILSVSLTAFFVIFLVFVKWSEKEPSLIYRPVLFGVFSAVSLGGAVLTWFLLCKNKVRRFYWLKVCVIIFSVLTTAGNVVSYQLEHGKFSNDLYDQLVTSEDFVTDPAYRIASNENVITLAHGFPAAGNFCSTVSGSIFRFYESIGLRRDVKSPDAPEGLYTLISAKYEIDTILRDKDSKKNSVSTEGNADGAANGKSGATDNVAADNDSGTVNGTSGTVSGNHGTVNGNSETVNGTFKTAEAEAVTDETGRILTGEYSGRFRIYREYEKTGIPPIGFTYDTYMTRSAFDELPVDRKIAAMLRALVIPDDKEDEIRGVLKKLDTTEAESIRKEDISRLGAAHCFEASEEFEKTPYCFKSIINAEKECYAFFSIPNDDGWTASVNGTEAEIIDVNGFMAVKTAQGRNEIIFNYETPGKNLGILATSAALIISAVYILADLIVKLARGRKRKKS